MHIPKPKENLQGILDERILAKLGDIPGLRTTEDRVERILHMLLALLIFGTPAQAFYSFLFRPWL